jgi:hypothetical protein
VTPLDDLNVQRRVLRLVRRARNAIPPVSRYRAVYGSTDFIFMLTEAWSLRKDKLLQMDAIMDKYGSIGASPYAVDIVSMALETRHGVWMAEVPIKPKGISKKKRTIGTPEFQLFTEYEGRFVNLLPMKVGAATLQ